MPVRRLPVRPDLEQLKHQAKDLLRALRAGDAEALATLQEHHPTPPSPADASLADAQLALARCYQASSWPRLVQAVQLADAIWEDDLATVRTLVQRNPHLLREHVLIRTDSNWGAPMSYAANLGRDAIIRFLHESGPWITSTLPAGRRCRGKWPRRACCTSWRGSPPCPTTRWAGRPTR